MVIPGATYEYGPGDKVWVQVTYVGPVGDYGGHELRAASLNASDVSIYARREKIRPASPLDSMQAAFDELVDSMLAHGDFVDELRQFAQRLGLTYLGDDPQQAVMNELDGHLREFLLPNDRAEVLDIVGKLFSDWTPPSQEAVQ